MRLLYSFVQHNETEKETVILCSIALYFEMVSGTVLCKALKYWCWRRLSTTLRHLAVFFSAVPFSQVFWYSLQDSVVLFRTAQDSTIFWSTLWYLVVLQCTLGY